MRPKDTIDIAKIARRIKDFSKIHNIPGADDDASRLSLAQQIVEGQRRIDFVTVVAGRSISNRRGDPSSSFFDPVRASILLNRDGEIDEAAWVVFLLTHCGHHIKDGWELCRSIYGGLGEKTWSWAAVSADVNAFRNWLNSRQGVLRGGDGVKRRFGNHRKYTSLDAWKPNATGEAVASYVKLVQTEGGHDRLFYEALAKSNGDGGLAFDLLYTQMRSVASFGRIARFDYLTMIGKIGISAINPISPYLSGATGPLQGAKLLFGPGKSIAEYENLFVELGRQTGFNMQVMEDSICNWQKSPSEFKPFRG